MGKLAVLAASVLLSANTFAASICSISTTSCEGVATCTAASSESEGVAFSGGGSENYWDVGTCQKEQSFLKCTQTTYKTSSANPGKKTVSREKSTYACCDKAGKAFVTNFKSDAEATCDHP